jgi:hypothetical protein
VPMLIIRDAESAPIRPCSFFCGYSRLCCIHCVHHGAVALDYSMNTLHVSPATVAGGSLLGAFLPTPAHNEWHSTTREKFHVMGYLCVGLPSDLFSSGFPHQNCLCSSSVPSTCPMPRPSHSFWLDHPNNIQ